MEVKLTTLPVELLELISSHLPNRDIKSLRLTCRLLKKNVRLRLNRVFLSANPLNIRVFRAIADHEEYCQKVTEIIWDDARLVRAPAPDELHPAENLEDLGMDPEEGCPNWFVEECNKNVDELIRRKGRDVDRPDHIARDKQLAAQPPLRTCWQFYQNLLQQQDEVLFSQSDVSAFIYGLERFPALKTITITPATHGWLYTPLYETPMIRAFPYGFNYPIPRGWPTSEFVQAPPYAYPWVGLKEAEKNRWRGFRILMRVLAEQQHNIQELIIDDNQLPTGLNCTMFHGPCEEYNALAALLKRPGFCRLDLAVLVHGQEDVNWSSFRHGHLHRALSETYDLRHFSFRTTVTLDTMPESDDNFMEHFIPLQTIFPFDKWSKLHHFGLSRFLVVQSDLISLLVALSGTLRSVELSFLKFIGCEGNWRCLLSELRDSLRWHTRPVTSRPKVMVGLDMPTPRPGYGIWLHNEVRDFLYGDGPNPFTDRFPNQVLPGVGIVRDTFQPEHERPYIKPRVLEQLGYLKRSAIWED